MIAEHMEGQLEADMSPTVMICYRRRSLDEGYRMMGVVVEVR